MRIKLYNNIKKAIEQLKIEYPFLDFDVYENKIVINGKNNYLDLKYCIYTNNENNKLEFKYPTKVKYSSFKKIYELLKINIEALIKKQKIILKRNKILSILLYNDFIFNNFEVLFEENKLSDSIKLIYKNTNINHLFIYQINKNKVVLKLNQNKINIKQLKDLKDLKNLLLKLNKFLSLNIKFDKLY